MPRRGKRPGTRSDVVYRAALVAHVHPTREHVRAFAIFVLQRHFGLPDAVAARIVLAAFPDGNSKAQAIDIG